MNKIKATMYHLGVVAFTNRATSTWSACPRYPPNHHYKPLADYQMLAQLAEDGALQGWLSPPVLLRLPRAEADSVGEQPPAVHAHAE